MLFYGGIPHFILLDKLDKFSFMAFRIYNEYGLGDFIHNGKLLNIAFMIIMSVLV